MSSLGRILLLTLLLATTPSLTLRKNVHWDSSFTINIVEEEDNNNNNKDKDRSSNNNINENDVVVKAPSSMMDPGPPPHDEAARMARYVTHNSNWGSLATISTRQSIEGFPFANVFSLSDGGSVKEASGIPYMYLTGLDVSVIDLKADSRCSLTMSLAQGAYCDQKNYDPEDPRCAHIILTGNLVKVAANSTEEDFARKAMFSRHPVMMDWPQDHGWFFGKLDIVGVLVLDYFGGVKTVSVQDYFKATPY